MKLRIVEDVWEDSKRSVEYALKIGRGELPVPKKVEKEIVMTPERFVEVFTAQRLRLLIYIYSQPGQTITQIAKGLRRNYAAVHRDIKFFDGMLLKVKKVKNTRVPEMMGPIEIPCLA